MANNLDYDTRLVNTNRRLPVQPGAVWKKGDFLIWTATGLAGPPAAGSNYGSGGFSATNRIAGKAVGNSVDPITGLTYTSADFEVAMPGIQFPIALYHSTPASAVPLLAQLGTDFELRNSALIGTLTIPQVDLTASTNKAVRIMDFVPSQGGVRDLPNWPDNVTGAAQYSLAWCEFLAAACAFTGAR